MNDAQPGTSTATQLPAAKPPAVKTPASTIKPPAAPPTASTSRQSPMKKKSPLVTRMVALDWFHKDFPNLDLDLPSECEDQILSATTNVQTDDSPCVHTGQLGVDDQEDNADLQPTDEEISEAVEKDFCASTSDESSSDDDDERPPKATAGTKQKPFAKERPTIMEAKSSIWYEKTNSKERCDAYREENKRRLTTYI